MVESGSEYVPVRLRKGRKAGRTLYVQLGTEPSDNDPLVGIVDTTELADLVVKAVNDWLAQHWSDRKVLRFTAERSLRP